MHQNGFDHVLKGGARQSCILASEEAADGFCYFYADDVLTVVEAFEKRGVDLAQLFL